MADYTRTNHKISNPLNIKVQGDGWNCPICGYRWAGSRIVDNHYMLRLSLYSGSPCTQVPERKDLEIHMCFKCRNKIYKAIKDTVEELKSGN